MIDDEIVAAVDERGGLRAIAISHPHYYTTMVEWARAFGCPILIHEDDAEWVMRPDDSVRPWSGETSGCAGITLAGGGHFSGGQVLHWDGRRLLLSGDIVQVIPDRAHVSFMYSYPNLIPLPPGTVDDIARRLEPWDFDTIVGAWWGTIVRAGRRPSAAPRAGTATPSRASSPEPAEQDLPARHARNVQLLGRPRIRPEPRQHLFLRVGLDHVQRGRRPASRPPG